MSNTGYPTPNNFSGDADFVCIPIFVPNKTEFKAAIYGMYSQLANSWYWKQVGTMSPDDAAWLSSRGLAMTDAYANCGGDMACEDVADCIESELTTNQTLINQITETVNASGFGNHNRVNPYLTKIQDRNVADFNTTEVFELEDCNLDRLWGGIRHGIVDRLDEALADTLQDVAAIPTIIGRNAAWLDIVPVLGDLAEAVVTSLSSVAPTLLSLYESYSSEATKDELACELFSMVCAECRYPTFEEIYNHFKNYGMPETPAIGAWVLETMTQLLTNPVGVLAKVAYFTLMTWQLGIMYLQATFNGNTGTSAIVRFASIGEDFANDNWLLLCETCNEQYRIATWDYTQQQYNSAKTTGFSTNAGTWIAGKGWRVDKTAANAGRLTMAQPFDPSWQIRSLIIQTDRPKTEWLSFQVVARQIVGSGTTGYNMTSSAAADANSRCVTGIVSQSNIQEMAVSITQDPYQVMYLKKLIVVFNTGNSPEPSIPTNDPDACGLS
jgi:hypothetical protein